MITDIQKPYIPLGARRKDPFVFRRFLEMGLEESASPFLDKQARKISRNLSLKASFFAFFLLLLSVLIPVPQVAEILLVAVYCIVGTPSLIDSIEDVFLRKDVNIDVLMTVAAFSAYFLGAGFEGALLLVLFAISGALENLVTLKAKNALSSVHQLAATKAYVVDEKRKLSERAVEDVSIGSIILVRAGEIVPLDGVVVEGASSISLQHLTGENLPLQKKEHDEVPAGSRLVEGSLTLKVINTSNDSTISRIIKLITKAQEAKPRLERWFERFGRVYAISIMCAACVSALFFVFYLELGWLGKEGAIYRSLAFLITASPCALILAVPIAYLSSLGFLASKGVVLKGGVVLDGLNECQVIAFDKTGTLTLGELFFLSCEKLENSRFNDAEILGMAASLERNSTHPIAKAITKVAEKEKVELYQIENVRVVPGLGVEGIVFLHGQKVKAYIGDVKALSQRLNVQDAAALKEKAENRAKEGKILAALCLDDQGYLFTFQDEPRPHVKKMLINLKAMGRRLLMLTGDHEESAAQISRTVGISEYYASLRPEDKLEKISALSREFGLAMVGDGVNDAPALARATVGICMGKIGSGTAQLAADCILLHDNIDMLDMLFEKAMKTKQIVRENLVIALSAIVFASIAALYGIVPLWLAVILHEGGTVCVGLNALRLLRKSQK